MLTFNENKIAVSKQVQVEMTRLRSEASLKPCLPFLYQTTNTEVLYSKFYFIM